MSIVEVLADRNKIDSEQFDRLLRTLYREIWDIVPAELSAEEPGARLVAHDLEIRFRERHEKDGPSNFDVEIEIRAIDFPSRRANIQKRTERIFERLRLSMGGLRFFVFILLSPGGFASR